LKKVSLQDIAKSLDVSTALVSFVLNDRGNEKGINKDTQQRVIDRAKELNYKPNHIARGLRLGKSETIGLIVADISNKFYAKIAKRIEEVASSNNFNLIMCSSDENPEKEIKLIEMLRERQVDGLIISSTQQDPAFFLQLKKEQFPFVLIDRQFKKLKTNYVGVENYKGAYDATDMLIKAGYSRIAFFNISPGFLSSVRERENGYRDALKDNGIRVKSQFIKEIDFENTKAQVHQELTALSQSPFNIDALLTVNNNIAVAALECMKELHILVPDDLALVSFDEIELFRFCSPSVTAIAQPVSNIGEEAVNILLNSIKGIQNGHFIQKKLPIKIIIRESCGCKLNNP
jgi:LacI family transcriptional regulator